MESKRKCSCGNYRSMTRWHSSVDRTNRVPLATFPSPEPCPKLRLPIQNFNRTSVRMTKFPIGQFLTPHNIYEIARVALHRFCLRAVFFDAALVQSCI